MQPVVAAVINFELAQLGLDEFAGTQSSCVFEVQQEAHVFLRQSLGQQYAHSLANRGALISLAPRKIEPWIAAFLSVLRKNLAESRNSALLLAESSSYEGTRGHRRRAHKLAESATLGIVDQL